MNLLPLALLVAVGLPAAGGILQTEQRVKLTPGQQSVSLVFESDSAITRAKPLCDCMKLTVEGTHLHVRIDASRFDVSAKKEIDVSTADGSRTRLTVHIDVPPAIILSSKSFVWERGKPAEQKKLTISIPPDSPVSAVLEAGLCGEDFDYQTEKIKEGRTYAVRLIPKSTAKKAFNRLVLKFQSSDPRFSQQIIYLRVK